MADFIRTLIAVLDALVMMFALVRTPATIGRKRVAVIALFVYGLAGLYAQIDQFGLPATARTYFALAAAVAGAAWVLWSILDLSDHDE